MLDYNELFYLKEYVPMANNYVFNDILPVAPLKLAALESCKDLATKVNDHIVTFRRNDTVELLRRQQDLNYRGYDVDSYLLDCKCRVSVPVRQRPLLTNLSAARICLQW